VKKVLKNLSEILLNVPGLCDMYFENALPVLFAAPFYDRKAFSFRRIDPRKGLRLDADR
jgi:hypothetical protein